MADVIININSEANELEIITEENPKKEDSKKKIIEKKGVRLTANHESADEASRLHFIEKGLQLRL